VCGYRGEQRGYEIFAARHSLHVNGTVGNPTARSAKLVDRRVGVRHNATRRDAEFFLGEI